MSIFKRKPKADKANAEKGQKESKEDGKKQARPEKPAQQPYKPTHAASDAVRKPVIVNGRIVSQDASDYAQRSTNMQHSLAPTVNQPFSHAGMRPVVTGSNPQPPYRAFSGGFNGMQRNKSAEVFTTDPDAPPMPTSSTSDHGQTTPRNGPAHQNSGYFSQPRNNAPSFDSPMLGNTKMAVAARDRGYINPHTSSDSGYGSTSHSRAPSEQMNMQELGRPHLPRDSSGFLPELSLSEELAREPAFSEASFGADEAAADTPAIAPRQPESVLKNGRAYQSQLDPSNESRFLKPNKSSRATQKQTRFEQVPEATTTMTTTTTSRQQDDHLQPLRSASSQYSQSQHLPEAVPETRPESATLPQQKFSLPARTSALPIATFEEPRPSFSAPVRHSTPPPLRYQEPQSQFTSPARTSTPPPAREPEQAAPPVRFSSPPPQSQHTATFAPLERIISPSLRSSQPPTGSLEGLKVNKRGKILDEEGEIIGELVEGDIMDCVRQRCNAYGEVLDDRGRVVGRVQSLEHTLDSPIMRVASPGPSPAPVEQQQQQHHYFAPQIQPAPPPRSETPSGRRKPRRESAASQREVFTPAWQRQSQNNQASLAWELRDHIASANAQAHPAITPAEYPGNITAVELDASGAHSAEEDGQEEEEGEEEEEEEEEEELTPIFDYSEVFMPVPTVPPRSARRSETPSPPVERQWAASQLIQSAPSPGLGKDATATATLQDAEKTPSRRVSAPPAQEPMRSQWQAPVAAYEQGGLAGNSESQQPTTQYRPSQPPAPSKHTSAIASAIVRAFSPTPQARLPTPQPAPLPTQPEPPQRQPTATPTPLQHPPSSSSKTLLRSPSDSSMMTDPSKSYSRPSMSPVPEDSVDILPTKPLDQQRSPALFSYKGAIPAQDGPAANTSLPPSRALGAKSPPLPTFPRQAFTGGGISAASPSVPAPMNSAQFSSAGGLTARGTPPRQFSTAVPGPRPIPAFQPQHKGSFNNAPLRRSPLGSHEITPPDSEQGSADNGVGGGDRLVGVASGMHSRQPSLRSMRSMQSTLTASGGKARTYFTHGGRVAVGEGEGGSSQLAGTETGNAMGTAAVGGGVGVGGGGIEKQGKEATPSVSGASTTGGKRKSRFSLGGFGRKGQAVAAH